VTIGEIRLVDLPPRGGPAQSGRRPAIIVQSKRSLVRVPTVLVIPLTSQLDALRFPGTVLAEADAQNGLRRTSVALVFQLTALDQRYLKDTLGEITTRVIDEIWLSFDELVGRK
jgi:mRNA interferase MazF